MRKVLLIFGLLFTVLLAGAQDFSNKGRDFWLTFPAHVDATGAILGIYITCETATSGTVKFGNTTLTFNVTPNTVSRLFLGPNGDAPSTQVYLSQTDGIAVNAGIHVQALKPVVVYAHIIRSARSGATLALPSQVWGKEYLVPSYRSAGQSGANSGVGIITVVAKDTNTTVEIIPAANTVTGRPVGSPYSVVLANPGDVYQVQFRKDEDISGSIVRSIATGNSSCKPIGVFSATTWSAFNCNGAVGGDNLLQQLFPTRSFGKTFVTAPFFNRNYDIFRVFVTDPTTVVTRTENGVSMVMTNLQKNTFYEYQTDKPQKFEGDKPISVVQYITSQSCYSNSFVSDPEMIVLNPIEQTINNISVFSAHQNFVPPGQSNVNQCYLNIIIKKIAAPTFRINNNLPSGTFVDIAGTDYAYLQENVSSMSSTNPIQNLKADSNFSAIAYGYGNVESYGYNAGTNVKDLFQFISIRNQHATIDFPATCVQTPFKFSIILDYRPSRLKWEFNGKFPDVDVTSPVFDSSYVLDGKTLYRYTLPNFYQSATIGTFPVTLFTYNPNADGCGGEQQIDFDLEVYDKPAARFTLQSSGCVGDSVRFTDASNTFGRVIQTYRWQMGDNTTDTVKNPVHKYALPGSYTVKQTIITDVGCLADTTAIVQITAPPVAAFNNSAPACSGGSVRFTDVSTIASGIIQKWIWDFGNGRKDTLNANTPRDVVFSQPGTYSISLTVISASGCSSVPLIKQLVVNQGPLADFTPPATVCLPNGKAQFTNLSSIAGGGSLSSVWLFGDGQTSTVTNPLHSYVVGGPFTVKLTVTSSDGCIKDTTKVISNIYNQPLANFTKAAEICLSDSARFTSNATAGNGQTINAYGWNFGNGSTSTLKDPAFKYTNIGTLSVSHWVTTTQGCSSDTVVKPIVVNALPVAAFNNTSGCIGQPMVFTDQSIAGAGTLQNWHWNFGNSDIRNLTNGNAVSVNFGTATTVTAKLAVTNSKGCKSDTLIKTIAINALPIVNFGLPEICLNDAFAQFTDSSTIADGTAAQFTWAWNFGDPGATAANPNTSTQQNPRHKYGAAGNYLVTLTVRSNNGCDATLIKTISINGDKPLAAFNLAQPNFCSNDSVTITNTSTVNFGNITRLEIFWDWPATTQKTTDENPVFNKQYKHAYAAFSIPASRTVQVRMVSYSGGVCMGENIRSFTLNAKPTLVFAAIPGICLNAAPRALTQASQNGSLPGTGTYTGVGVLANGNFDPQLAGIGTHTIKYKFITSAGCTDSLSQTITVWPLPIADFTIANPVCGGQATLFTDGSTAGAGSLAQWDWNFGDGTTLNRNLGTPFTKNYDSLRNYAIQLQVATNNGCQSLPVSKTVNVQMAPIANFDLPVVCMPGGEARFINQSTIANGTQNQLGYNWLFGVPGATSQQKDPVYNYAAAGQYSVTLKVTAQNGCTDSITKLLTEVLPQPLANFDILPNDICLGTAMQFTDRSNPLTHTVTGWFWSFGDTTFSTQQNNQHLYSVAGNYPVSFYYTTTKGCNSDTVTKIARVNDFPLVDAGPDLVLLAGGEVTLEATVTGSTNNRYVWAPNTWLSNPAILQPTSKAERDITYTLTVAGNGGCTGTDLVNVKVLPGPVISNAFSPNGDGINDTWIIRYLDESFPDLTVQVFDRYGRIVFSSKGYPKAWNGQAGGKMLPTGVYYYIIDPKIGQQRYTGSLTILR